jgi:hypothetical protein
LTEVFVLTRNTVCKSYLLSEREPGLVLERPRQREYQNEKRGLRGEVARASRARLSGSRGNPKYTKMRKKNAAG